MAYLNSRLEQISMLLQNQENLLFGFIYENLKEILKFRYDFSFIKMKYSNMRIFSLYCPSELIKKVTSFKLEPYVDVNFEVLGSNPKKATIIKYY